MQSNPQHPSQQFLALLDCPVELRNLLHRGANHTFSTYCYLLQHLSEMIPLQKIHTVPGITSYNAAACAFNFSLIEQNEKLAIIPVSQEINELRPILETFETIILMKVAKKLDAVIDLLDQMNLIDNSLFASYVGLSNEFITNDLDSLRGSKRGYLSVIIVRKADHKNKNLNV